jgi:hypothetical protein
MAGAAYGRPDKTLFTILFMLYVGLSLIRFMWPHTLLTLGVIGLGLLAFFVLSAHARRVDLSTYVFVACLLLSVVVSSLLVLRRGWRPFFPIGFVLSSAGIAMLLLRRHVYSWGAAVVFYALAAYFLTLMLCGIDAEVALHTTSRNGISMVMLVACVSLYVTLVMEGKKIGLLPAVLTLVVSAWGIGRSGILASAVLLLGLLLCRLRTNRALIPLLALSAIIAYATASWFIPLVGASPFGRAVDNYQVKAEYAREVRLGFWSNYLDNLDPRRILIGVNVLEDPWPEGEINEYNYHNSFIALHSQTGVMGLITIALMIGALLKCYKDSVVLLSAFLAVISRWGTDNGMFFNAFDFVPFFFIFYFLSTIRLRSRRMGPVASSTA